MTSESLRLVGLNLRLVDLNNYADGVWLATINAVVLNRAIQSYFLKSQRSENRLKRHINYRFLFT